ncbi:hypothetical protein [Streptomyces sp. ID05-47C]|uniref:hypothetical protein n=1 Tax=Streptomyces sp. ID05-47C TaxID=3028665 RepID=UPI0029AE53DF|nr:hypothetical protein [Streptomyces sp. ID05-47C]MDX3568652.1 hypothetical protein [Streptomyces sp. ID05-47C]
MTVASTGKTIEMAEDTESDHTPVDVEAVSSRTNSVLGLRMDTTTRAAMGRQLPALAGDLNRLLKEDLGAACDNEVRQLLREGTRLIDLTNRPTAETPTFGIYLYLRDVALLTRRLLWIYTERNGLGAP